MIHVSESASFPLESKFCSAGGALYFVNLQNNEADWEVTYHDVLVCWMLHQLPGLPLLRGLHNLEGWDSIGSPVWSDPGVRCMSLGLAAWDHSQFWHVLFRPLCCPDRPLLPQVSILMVAFSSSTGASAVLTWPSKSLYLLSSPSLGHLLTWVNCLYCVTCVTCILFGHRGEVCGSRPCCYMVESHPVFYLQLSLEFTTKYLPLLFQQSWSEKAETLGETRFLRTYSPREDVWTLFSVKM